jgi:hypothetical protein
MNGEGIWFGWSIFHTDTCMDEMVHMVQF